jgi:hypothetical protein
VKPGTKIAIADTGSDLCADARMTSTNLIYKQRNTNRDDAPIAYRRLTGTRSDTPTAVTTIKAVAFHHLSALGGLRPRRHCGQTGRT